MALERLEPYAGKLARTVLRGADRSNAVGLLDHGYQYLSHVFGILLFLAFLIDQIQQHCCGLFQAAVQKTKSNQERDSATMHLHVYGRILTCQKTAVNQILVIFGHILQSLRELLEISYRSFTTLCKISL